MRTAVDSEAGTYTLGYDDLGRLTSEESPQGEVTYSYDDLGRRQTMDVTGGASTSYDYFNDDSIEAITQGTEEVGFAYDPAGRLDTLTLPNGVIQDYDYDATSALESITYGDGTNVLGDLNYERDEVGRLIATSGSWARTTIPDAMGSATYDDANRLTAWGTESFTYDDNGNMTSDGTSDYAFDARNELRSVDGPEEGATFEYDPFGRRQKTTFGTDTSEYFYDGLNVIEEQESGGTETMEFMTGLGLDQTYVRTTTSGSEYLLADSLGSTIALAGNSGTVTSEYTYSPFGEVSASGTASDNPFTFTGRESDPTGLSYLRARYYNTEFGRFISQDPVGFASGDANLYRYAWNSPMEFSDPLGLWGIHIPVGDMFDGLKDFVGDVVSLPGDIYGVIAGRKAEAWSDNSLITGFPDVCDNGSIAERIVEQLGLSSLPENILEPPMSAAGRGAQYYAAKGIQPKRIIDGWLVPYESGAATFLKGAARVSVVATVVATFNDIGCDIFR